ncbi:Histidine kinase-, DNA gyrase B-, and HSP90-like ATPase [compost metagenome]
MKIAVGSSVTTSNIQTAGRSFGIQANGKAFKILSSSLYNFKVLAVVREISCNARDAHAMVKKLQEPFTVKLPCMEDLHFTVRDYGPGLSPENVMGMYTTYFESTKMHDNDSVGGFGLGSKSPLSYATSFQVVTYFDGMKTTFLAFQNDSGEPDIYQLSQQATTEPTGLEVIVPVNENDIRKFRTSAENVYRFFEVPPTIYVGKRQLPANELFRYNLQDKMTREVFYEDNKSGRFYSGVGGGDFSEITTVACWAQMGDVVYPISSSHVFDSSKHEESQMLRFFESGRFGKLLIRFTIGELDLNAGREGLSYDRATIGRLKTVMSLIYGRLIQEANAEIAKSSHYDVAVRDSAKFQQFFGQDAVYGMFTWRGKKVDRRTFSTFPAMEQEHPEWKAFIDGLVKLGGGNGMRYALTSNIRGDLTVRQITGANITRLGPNTDKKMHFVIVDEALNGSRGSIRDRLVKKFGLNGLSNDVSVIVLKVSQVSVSNTKGTESASCVYRDVAKNIAAVKKLVGDVTLVENISFLSELPVAEVTKNVSTTSSSNGIRREVQEVYCMTVGKKGENHLYRAMNFGTTEFDPDATTQHFYIQGNKTRVLFRDDERATSRTQYSDYWDSTHNGNYNLLHAWAEHHAAGTKDGKFVLYYLNEKQIEEVAANKNWVPVEDYIFTEFALLVKGVGKYGALKLSSASISESETHKALLFGSADYNARAKEWNELAGQRSGSAFGTGSSFGSLMLSLVAATISDKWATWSVEAGIDKVLYPSYDSWIKVFRNGTTRNFVDYVTKMSPMVAHGQFARWNDKIQWKPEICTYWDSIPNKISVTSYLDQFFTGKN